MPDQQFMDEWRRHALEQIRTLVDKDRDEMTDTELSIYTYANNALAGGDPWIAMFERGPGQRLCRICGAEWSLQMTPRPRARLPGDHRLIDEPGWSTRQRR